MSRRQKHKKSNGISFLVYPIAFLLLNLIMLLIAFGPIFKSVLGVLDVVTLDEAPSFSSSGTDEIPKIEPPQETVDIVTPSYGEMYANIIIPSAGIDAPVYFGDDNSILRKGVGTYSGTYVPGQRRTILMAGHNYSVFNTLGKASVGDIITIKTTYGEYKYEITGNKIAMHDDSSVYDLAKQEENLILYTCYPFNAIGLPDERYFVYAKYVSGPQVEEKGVN